MLRDKAETQEARLHLERALAINADYTEAWYNLADLRDAGGDAAGARAALESAVTADPGYADAVFNLAEAHVRQGAYGYAVRCFERYLALDLGSEWSARAIVWICASARLPWPAPTATSRGPEAAQATRRTASTALSPPNAKELVRATSIRAARAWLGT